MSTLFAKRYADPRSIRLSLRTCDLRRAHNTTCPVLRQRALSVAAIAAVGCELESNCAKYCSANETSRSAARCAAISSTKLSRNRRGDAVRVLDGGPVAGAGALSGGRIWLWVWSMRRMKCSVLGGAHRWGAAVAGLIGLSHGRLMVVGQRPKSTAQAEVDDGRQEWRGARVDTLVVLAAVVEPWILSMTHHAEGGDPNGFYI